MHFRIPSLNAVSFVAFFSYRQLPLLYASDCRSLSVHCLCIISSEFSLTNTQTRIHGLINKFSHRLPFSGRIEKMKSDLEDLKCNLGT